MSYVLRDALGREYPIGEELQIGRDPANPVVVDDPLASRVHATLWEQQGALYLRDENSSNGTYVNDGRVQEVMLRPGDQIRIAASVFVVAVAQGSQPVPPSTSMGTTKRRSGCARWLLIGCLLSILGCAALGLGGFAAYRAGVLTPQTVLNLIGLGPGLLEVDNFRDDPIQLSILQLDAPADVTPTSVSLEVEPFDIRTVRIQDAGRYQIQFTSSSDGAELGACTLNVKSGGEYQFVTLPERIVIHDVKHPASVGTDMIVETSTLCQ
ncbi:MAG TPA: FHA domain-containing protein [Anaerolineales bacterium]|nr:FHA domain-containing protein [Anaerolineales bacterium]